MIATRVQFPLSLYFASTVHKAQGLSIENLVVVCDNMLSYGLFSVAIGRAKRSSSLVLENFEPQLHIVKPTQKLKAAVTDMSSKNIDKELQCCNKQFNAQPNIPYYDMLEADFEGMENPETDDQQREEEIDSVQREHTNSVLTAMLIKHTKTAAQRKHNSNIEKLLKLNHNDIHEVCMNFLKKSWINAGVQPGTQKASSQLTQFLTLCHEFSLNILPELTRRFDPELRVLLSKGVYSHQRPIYRKQATLHHPTGH